MLKLEKKNSYVQTRLKKVKGEKNSIGSRIAS